MALFVPRFGCSLQAGQSHSHPKSSVVVSDLCYNLELLEIDCVSRLSALVDKWSVGVLGMRRRGLAVHKEELCRRHWTVCFASASDVHNYCAGQEIHVLQFCAEMQMDESVENIDSALI